jgi:SAM-dependent methyltransferase
VDQPLRDSINGKGFAGWLRRWLAHPLARDLDLESSEATEVHARLIREKALLRRLYHSYYVAYDEVIARATPGGLIVEIGSGGGYYRSLRPNVISIDLRPGADVDVVGSALAIPLRTNSTSAILLLNVLHHLPNPVAFFHECARILTPGGRVCLIEPYVGPMSRRVVRPLHHEPWDESAAWSLPDTGPMTAANMAMPWIIFFRDRARYDSEFAQLPVSSIRLHTMALYLLSGGVSMRALLPGFLFGPTLAVEHLLSPLAPRLATMMTVELVRR